jgi:hypothetical protein
VNKLPNFNLVDYENLLISIKQEGYLFKTNREMSNDISKKTCFLRHDIDAHLFNIDMLSEIEFNIGVSSTYFILLSSIYNVMEPSNKRVIEKIIKQGHEIGLHYDLMEYPITDPEACKKHLSFEITLLETIFNIKIESIVMHQPFTGVPDIFKENSGFKHPHDPQFQKGVVYISDSCRAWRDEKLLTCFTKDAPICLQLNIHPEVWLGFEEDRIDFLENTLFNNLIDGSKKMLSLIKDVYLTHDAAKLHNKRIDNA